MMIGTLHQHTYSLPGGEGLPAPGADWRDWEMELAREVQSRAFPNARPRIAGLDYYSDWRPARGLSGVQPPEGRAGPSWGHWPPAGTRRPWTVGIEEEVMLLHASSSAEVPMNVQGTLEAAHDAIQAFFLLSALFESEAKVWWVFNHRAFLEAMCIGNVLKDAAKKENGEELLAKDPLFIRAKSDIGRSPFLSF